MSSLIDSNPFGCSRRESCRKQHYSEKCEVIDCDRRCSKRHPKERKHGEKCRFKNICAFDHDGVGNKNTKVMDIIEQKLLSTEKKFTNRRPYNEMRRAVYTNW